VSSPDVTDDDRQKHVETKASVDVETSKLQFKCQKIRNNHCFTVHVAAVFFSIALL